MHIVHKYTLDHPIKTIEMPFVRVLAVQEQHGKIQVWVLCNPIELANVEVEFFVYGTGSEIEDAMRLCYAGTVQMYHGEIVWHVFYRVREKI